MSDKNIFPMFFTKTVEDKAKTREAGRPMYKDVEYVEIRIAGDKNNLPVYKVGNQHRQRWPDQYEAFKRNQEQPVEGTRIEEWPTISRARAMELKALRIFTVEALAEIPDTVIHRIGMGARELVAQAKAYLEAAEGTADVTAMAAEIERLKEENELLKRSVGNDELIKECERLKEELAKLKAPSVRSKPKRKRRTKAQMAEARASG